MQDIDILSLIVFFPVIGILILGFIDRREELTLKTVALVTAIVTFFLSLIVFANFKPGGSSDMVPGYQFANYVEWIPQLGVRYVIGIDGISLYLLLLTTFLLPVCILGTWNHIKSNIKLYLQMLLLVTVGISGV